MSDLLTFPANKREALAMLYLQNQDLTGKSPAEIVDMFEDTYEQIRDHYKNRRKTNNFTY